MRAKYEACNLHGSKVIAKFKLDNRQTDAQDESKMPQLFDPRE